MMFSHYQNYESSSNQIAAFKLLSLNSTRCPQSKEPFLNASFAQIICRTGFKLYTYMANDRKFLFSKSSEVVHVLFSRRSEFVQKLDHT